MSNAFLDETRTERIDLGLPICKQLRASPTVFEVLAEEKPATMSWGDFATISMISFALMGRNLRGDFRGAYCQAVRIFGTFPDVMERVLTDVRRPDKPPTDGKGR